MSNDHDTSRLTSAEKDSFIREVYSERVPLSQVLRKDLKNLVDLLKRLNSDSVHFIYELLQNAEDVGATEVCFYLSRDCLEFEHNGKPFSKKDIRSITTFAVSSKTSDEDTIGRFGIGFRSVFEYTSSPRIWSPTYSFVIKDIVLPHLLPDRDDLGNLTRFEFPFNSVDKDPKIAYREISEKLRNISEDTLLFLNSIISIEWKIDESEAGSIVRIEGDKHLVEVMKQVNNQATSSLHFLLFSEPLYAGHDSLTQRVSVAYALELLPGVAKIDERSPLSKQTRVSPVKGNVAVFFPATKETSGLHFHLHAPFITVPNRDSIKDVEENNSLITRLADLCCRSLHEIRDAGLLTKDLFRALPSSKDALGEKYIKIRNRIIQEFNTQPLMPTFAGGYAPAETLCQARESLKGLLTKEDLRFLGGFRSDLQMDWAVNGDLQGTDIERFMSSTAIRDWGTDKFIEVLSNRLNRKAVSKSHLDWLEEKPMDWLQMFYNVLSFDSTRCEDRLTNSVIVKLSDETFSTAKGSYFPKEDHQHSNSMPCIDIKIIQTKEGKTRPQNKRLLERLGVAEIDEYQLIHSLLRDHYNRADSEFHVDTSIAHLQTFIQAFKQDKDKYSSLFSESSILYGHDKRWHKPSEIFIDSPFENTDMLAYYRCFNEPKTLAGLSEKYFNSNIDCSDIVSFAIGLGALRNIPVEATSCKFNPNKSHFLNAPGSRRTNTSIDQDWRIKSFDEIEKKMNLTMSKLILRTIQDLEECDKIDIKMRARYRKSHLYETRQGLSQLAYQLKDGAWVPQANDLFVSPGKAKYEELPDGFNINRDSSWVHKVGFGDNLRIDSFDIIEEEQQRMDALEALGFDSSRTSELDRLFRKLAEFPFERIQDLVPDLIQKIEDSDYPFPKGEAVHGDQRGKRIKEEAEEAPDRTEDKRVRKVHLSVSSVKENARQYLTQQYTRDGTTFCQICHKPMPFNLDDGSPFVMKVEFLRGFDKRHYRNHLLLCPNHGAMFIHANHDRDNLRDMVGSMEGLDLQISLAQSSFTIRFTEQHIYDIKKIMESDRGGSHNDNLSTDEDD